MLNSFLSMRRDLEQDNGHSSVLVQRKSGTLLVKTVHKENGTELQSKWCWHLQKADTQSSDPWVHCPEVSSRAKAVDNCQYTIALTRERLKLFFAQLFLLISSVLTEQSQKCVKKVTPVMIEQGDLLWKDNLTHCSCQVWWRHTYLWPMTLHNQKKICCKDVRNELKSNHNKIEWANFVLVQDSWPQLKSDSISWRKTLKNSHNSQIQWPRDETLSKRWIRGNTKIGPVVEVTTCCLQGKHGVEIRIESMNKDHSHSWVRISHGLNKLVTNLNNKEQDDNEQETSEMQFEDYALKSNARAVASRSKAKAKPLKRISASSSTKTIPIGERTWTDIEPQDYSLTDYSGSKKLINLLRHGSLPREDDGAIEFWRIQDYLQKYFMHSTLVWWKVEEHHGKRRRKQDKISLLYWFFMRNSLLPSSSRSFRTQSYWSFITGQCLDCWRFLQVHLSRWMCNQFTFHHQCRIGTGRSTFEQTTDSILSACGSHGQRTQRSWEYRLRSTASCTKHAYSMEETLKNAVYWVDIKFAQKKGS